MNLFDAIIAAQSAQKELIEKSDHKEPFVIVQDLYSEDAADMTEAYEYGLLISLASVHRLSKVVGVVTKEGHFVTLTNEEGISLKVKASEEANKRRTPVEQV